MLNNTELLKLIADRFCVDYRYGAIKGVDKTLAKKLGFSQESVEYNPENDNCIILTHYGFNTCCVNSLSPGTILLKEDDVAYFIYKTLIYSPYKIGNKSLGKQ